jgi:hypothetical protein
MKILTISFSLSLFSLRVLATSFILFIFIAQSAIAHSWKVTETEAAQGKGRRVKQQDKSLLSLVSSFSIGGVAALALSFLVETPSYFNCS